MAFASIRHPKGARLTDAALVEPVRFEKGLQRHLDPDCAVHAVDDGDVPSDPDVKARPQAYLKVVLSRSPADLHELPTIELARLHHPKRPHPKRCLMNVSMMRTTIPPRTSPWRIATAHSLSVMFHPILSGIPIAERRMVDGGGCARSAWNQYFRLAGCALTPPEKDRTYQNWWVPR